MALKRGLSPDQRAWIEESVVLIMSGSDYCQNCE